MLFRGRKASLSLSVNAIVVLILAIVLLAFGLSFITKLLSKGESSLEGLFPSPEVQPTANKPIAMPDTLLVKPGTSVRLNVPVLNAKAPPAVLTGSFVITTASGKCPEVSGTDYVSGSISNLASGDVGSVKLLIKGQPVYQDNSICNIEINGVKGSFFLTTKGSI